MTQILLADLDDMVFEGREKRYGAYMLRKAYSRNLRHACLMVSLLFAGSATAHMLWQKFVNKPQEVVTRVVSLPPTVDPPPRAAEPDPPALPPKRTPPITQTTSYLIPDPSIEDELTEENTITDVEELAKAANIGIKDVAGEEIGLIKDEMIGDGDIPNIISNQEPDMDTFITVQEEPEPINMSALQKEIGYPAPAVMAEIQGVVVVRILVDEKGQYVKHKTIQQVHPLLAKAVEKHIHKLSFTPAIQANRPIKFWVNVPFRFKLMN
ncbi:MAG: TonB family protein [Bacteroidota bacterium]